MKTAGSFLQSIAYSGYRGDLDTTNFKRAMEINVCPDQAVDENEEKRNKK